MKRQDIDYDQIAKQYLEENELHEEKFNFFSHFMEFIEAFCWCLGGLLLAPFFLLFAKEESEGEDD